MVSDERALKHLNAMLGSSLIASSAYQKWPAWSYHLPQRFTKVTTGSCPFKFENRSRTTRVPDSYNHSLYLIKLFNASYSEGNLGGNQPLDGSISLSPLFPSIKNDVHVSIATPEFPLILPFSGIVHYLAGSYTCALTQTTRKITVSCRCPLSLRLQV